jgi:hypothetical protein
MVSKNIIQPSSSFCQLSWWIFTPQKSENHTEKSKERKTRIAFCAPVTNERTVLFLTIPSPKIG